jgi:hypothetical protein
MTIVVNRSDFYLLKQIELAILKLKASPVDHSQHLFIRAPHCVNYCKNK